MKLPLHPPSFNSNPPPICQQFTINSFSGMSPENCGKCSRTKILIHSSETRSKAFSIYIHLVFSLFKFIQFSMQKRYREVCKGLSFIRKEKKLQVLILFGK